jgi:hypothetical protein
MIVMLQFEETLMPPNFESINQDIALRTYRCHHYRLTLVLSGMCTTPLLVLDNIIIYYHMLYNSMCRYTFYPIGLVG